MKTTRLTWMLAAALLAAAVNGCGGAAARKDAAGDPADAALLSVKDLAPVTHATLATGVPVQGTLEPAVDVTIIAPFPEILDAVMVKEGQSVRRGQVLARLRLASVVPAAASADAQRRVAAADFERMKNLFQAGAVSQRDVDEAGAQLKAAEAGAALAKKRLDESTVTAPQDGVIATRFVQAGDRVGDGDPLFRFVNTAELEFSASVPTDALAQVRPGAPVALTVSGMDGAAVGGRVARVNATVDAATRQVKIYVTVPNPGHRLAGDMFATGRIVLSEAKDALALPAAGLRTDPDGSAYAWVVAGGKLERRAVQAGVRDELRDLIEVKSGLKEGEMVIVSPIEGLQPGQPVRVTGEPAAAGAGPDSAARKEK